MRALYVLSMPGVLHSRILAYLFSFLFGCLWPPSISYDSDSFSRSYLMYSYFCMSHPSMFLVSSSSMVKASFFSDSETLVRIAAAFVFFGTATCARYDCFLPCAVNMDCVGGVVFICGPKVGVCILLHSKLMIPTHFQHPSSSSTTRACGRCVLLLRRTVLNTQGPPTMYTNSKIFH